MKEITCKKTKGKLEPWLDDDKELLSGYDNNELYRVKIIGNDKNRSLQQLGLYQSCCGLVASNTDNRNWDTKQKVSDQALIGAGWVDYRIVTPEGNVIVKPKSISFKNMTTVEANGVLNKALDIMAAFLNVSLFELIENAKDSMD